MTVTSLDVDQGVMIGSKVKNNEIVDIAIATDITGQVVIHHNATTEGNMVMTITMHHKVSGMIL